MNSIQITAILTKLIFRCLTRTISISPTTLLRSNTTIAKTKQMMRGMANAWDLGSEHERDVVCSLLFNMIKDISLAQNIVDTIRVRE